MLKRLLALLLCHRSFHDVSLFAESHPVQSFGALADGRPVHLYTLENRAGLKTVISDYGGTVVSLHVPDRAGQSADVVLGFNSLPDYQTKSPYFGCLVGRVGNRIAHGK